MLRSPAPIWMGLGLALACGNATPLRVDRFKASPEPAPEEPASAPAPVAGSASPPDDAIDCAAVTVRVDRVTPKVLLLVDGSSSMQDNVYPAGSQTSRWDAVRAALLDPDKGVVPAMQGLLKFGLAIYGSGAPDAFIVPSAKDCPLPLGVVTPALNQGEEIGNRWPMLPPGTFTPTGEALELVLRMLADWRGGPAAEPEVIVLATDGNPNGCSPQQLQVPDYQPTIDAALHAREERVKLYVISLGTDADGMHLQQIANIGAGLDAETQPGAPLYYPENVEQLTATLRDLLGKELSCELLLEGDGVDPAKQCLGSVRLNGEPLACEPVNGFRVKDPLHLELLGTACARLRAAPEVALEVAFPCEALLGFDPTVPAR